MCILEWNWIHAHLSHLGFDGVYPIYWIKKSKHAIRYTYSKYVCTILSRTKRDTIWTKTPTKPRKHTQVWQEKEMSKLYQRIGVSNIYQLWFSSVFVPELLTMIIDTTTPMHALIVHAALQYLPRQLRDVISNRAPWSWLATAASIRISWTS